MKPEKARILIIEDEEDVHKLIELHLKRQGFETESAMDGTEGLSLARKKEFSLIVLDWMLPSLSGLDFLKIYRQDHPDVPVLMVTARAETDDIVAGLDAGADDYLTKPFEVKELIARVQALLRRLGHLTQPSDSEIIEIGSLKINKKTRKAHCGENFIPLTKYEFNLLLALMQERGRVLTRDQLIERVQGEGVKVIRRAIDTHVFGLRKKLGPCSDCIETIRGIGYRVLDES